MKLHTSLKSSMFPKALFLFAILAASVAGVPRAFVHADFGPVTWQVATTSGTNSYGYPYTWSAGSIIWQYSFSASPGFVYVFSETATTSNDFILGTAFYPTENPPGTRPLGGSTGSLSFMSGKHPGFYTACIHESNGPVNDQNCVGASAAFTYYWDGNQVSDHLITSNISTSTTWGEGVYVLSGEISVDSGVTLSIDSGAVIKFDTSTTSSLTINGTLDAWGENDQASTTGWSPVVFTSLRDDNIGLPNDTNRDGSSTSPMPGDWGGLIINSGGTAHLEGVILRYAGNAGIYNNGGDIFIASSSITKNSSYGIYNNSGSVDVYGTDIGFQDYGLYVAGGTAEVTATSTIHDNDIYGIENATLTTVNASNNYWGTSTGPSSIYGSAVYGLVNTDNPIPTLHFINLSCTENGDSCLSVVDHNLLYVDESIYGTELNTATTTWGSAGSVNFVPVDLTSAKLRIFSKYQDDWIAKGGFHPNHEGSRDVLFLNTYYLDVDSFAERVNTITHELGHAQGLLHSYTGNIMFHNQSSQYTLGPQDLRDYHFLWP